MKIWIANGDVTDPILSVSRKGKAILFENASMNPYQSRVEFEFTLEQFDYFYKNLYELATEIWGPIEPKDAKLGCDYREYYDRELDNNGEAAIDEKGIYFNPPAPHLESNRLYRFTKKNIETYLYDLRKHTSFAFY